MGAPGMAVALGLAGLGVIRALGWTSFHLPRVRRQTPNSWPKPFEGAAASALWGFDVGLTFTTRFTFSGLSLLAALAILVGQPAFGAGLFAAFWLGRAASVWIGPFLLPDANATPRLLGWINREVWLFRGINVAGNTTAILLLLLVHYE